MKKEKIVRGIEIFIMDFEMKGGEREIEEDKKFKIKVRGDRNRIKDEDEKKWILMGDEEW